MTAALFLAAAALAALALAGAVLRVAGPALDRIADAITYKEPTE